MKRSLCASLLAASGILHAADLPPDQGNTIPESASRPVVVSDGGSGWQSPQATLPEGLELVTAAASPLVTHPIMGCVDERGRLFVGDAVGVNWNKAQLEANPPNRILMLEDTNRDGRYDKSTIYADKLTFPQGACWLDGSLYVCSPPSLWKLTDADGDGVAEKREVLVSGFEYTGNAADVHGPFLHPNGRLYWCHGRKGHRVVGKDGTVVHEGLACGIWSCKPDGTDVAWHALGCGDNPVEVDFTPSGEVIGVQNLYYSQPRGDTIVHWLYGGVYERADQLKAIAGMPRTLAKMPVMYNFGHVAVSGCTFVRHPGAVLTPSAPDALELLVTHFNTQRLVRMELTASGATYKAAENEFLKMHSPDIHLTDVMEDRDGSLLLVNTGGWFRIGCPSSLMAKPDIQGAIYRIQKTKDRNTKAIVVRSSAYVPKDLAADLSGVDMHRRQLALQWAAEHQVDSPDVRKGLLALMKQPLDEPSEHGALYAAEVLRVVSLADLKAATDPLVQRRMLVACHYENDAEAAQGLDIAAAHLDSEDADLARTALDRVTMDAAHEPAVSAKVTHWLDEDTVTPARLSALSVYCSAFIAQPGAQGMVTRMLRHDAAKVRRSAVDLLAQQTSGASNADWIAPLRAMLDNRSVSMPALLDAIKKLKNSVFDSSLQAIAGDEKQPLALRLKALDAIKGLKLTDETFRLLTDTLTGGTASAAARIQAAEMLSTAPLKPEQLVVLTPALASVGPIELKELCGMARRLKDEAAVRSLADAVAHNPAIASQQESFYRTTFSSHPPQIFEGIILPALQKANEAMDAKKRLLAPLAVRAAAQGDAAAGRSAFEHGTGTCVACHKIGNAGRPIGPDLSKIGSIRTERDLLESIMFPSNTLARDYEAHVLETNDGQTIMGVIKSHTAEGLLVADITGQERNIPQTQIVSDTTLTTSLMPMGLDQTMPEKDLLNLVAYLRSLR